MANIGSFKKVGGELPAAEEFRFMLDDVRTAAAQYSHALKKLP
jgi:hypothetical protein